MGRSRYEALINALTIASYMRVKQRAYFIERTRERLIEAKAAERLFDTALKEIRMDDLGAIPFSKECHDAKPLRATRTDPPPGPGAA